MSLPFHCRRTLVANVLIVSVLIATSIVGAGAGDVGPDVARQLLNQGRISPLSEILDKVKAKVPGEVLEIELELEDGVYVYDVKLLSADGRVQEVEVDAKTGAILMIEDDD